jgi:trimethylamine--corrinoid protein Co-methyltransferase
MIEQTVTARRHGGRAARRAERTGPAEGRKPVHPGLEGGKYRPLSDHEIERIHGAALDLLERVGMAEPTPEFQEIALAKGASLNEKGRLCFPRSLVEDVIAGAARDFILYGRDPKHDLEVTGTRVYTGTEGAAVTVLDVDTGARRDSTLLDLYDSARLVDRLDHIHRFDETVISTEITDPLAYNVNKAYACLTGTTKNFGIDITDAQYVEPVVAMFDMVLGGEGKFRERPFALVVGTPVVSPLRYGADNSGVFIAAARAGMPVNIVAHVQAGATGPAALAGTLVQSVAENLAHLLLMDLAAPGQPLILGNWPIVFDLKRGAYSVGGGEQALLNAASAQISNFYDLPSGVYAGGSDSKLPDNQAGYEKGLATAMAGLAGANFVCECGGQLSSLMCFSFESLVIDDEMLGAVLRTVRGIEVTDETLSVDVIEEVVNGSGHFLDHPQTLALMESEYVYPTLADRSSTEEWQEKGERDMHKRAHERVHELLGSHYPSYIERQVDEAIRERFPIRLPRKAMQPDCGRW